MPVVDFSTAVDWANERSLRKMIKEECGITPAIGIENKRNQIIDYMSGLDLTTQLEFLGKEVHNELVPVKRNWLKSIVNSQEEEG